MVSVGQKGRRSLAKPLTWVLIRLQSGCHPWLGHTRLFGGYVLSSLSWLLAVSKRSIFSMLTKCGLKIPVPCHVILSLGQLVAWQLASPRASTEKEKETRMHPRSHSCARTLGRSHSNLVSKGTSNYFCHILLLRKKSWISAHGYGYLEAGSIGSHFADCLPLGP